RQTALAVAANTAANASAAAAATAAADEAAETAGISETARVVDSEKLSAAENRISTLEDELTDLNNRLIESEAALKAAENKAAAVDSSSPVAASQWHLYGIIVQIRGETLVVEPLTNQIPSDGSEIRVMRSLGQDRVIHLADGSIVQANATRATCRISSNSDGAEIYGIPNVDDLIYISAH
ncbi:MAG: hypothetical protein KAH21_06340, partial [Spirochaetaceae bacterium]|nr:hypothetical protein [Spirochaetaceae bacterium]